MGQRDPRGQQTSANPSGALCSHELLISNRLRSAAHVNATCDTRASRDTLLASRPPGRPDFNAS